MYWFLRCYTISKSYSDNDHPNENRHALRALTSILGAPAYFYQKVVFTDPIATASISTTFSPRTQDNGFITCFAFGNFTGSLALLN